MSHRSAKRRCLARALSAPTPRLLDVAIVAAALAILAFLPTHTSTGGWGAADEALLVNRSVVAEAAPSPGQSSTGEISIR